MRTGRRRYEQCDPPVQRVLRLLLQTHRAHSRHHCRRMRWREEVDGNAGARGRVDERRQQRNAARAAGEAARGLGAVRLNALQRSVVTPGLASWLLRAKKMVVHRALEL